MSRQLVPVLPLLVAVIASLTARATMRAESAGSSADVRSSSTAASHATRQALVASDSTVLGVFEGRTPCGAIAVEFTGFPAQNCEKIKWRLTLHRDPRSGAPTTYLYEGTRSTRRGSWRIARGTPSNPNAVVYHLSYEPSAPGRTISFLPVDDRILLLLDRDLRVVTGDASWSYTLNRVERNR